MSSEKEVQAILIDVNDRLKLLYQAYARNGEEAGLAHGLLDIEYQLHRALTLIKQDQTTLTNIMQGYKLPPQRGPIG